MLVPNVLLMRSSSMKLVVCTAVFAVLILTIASLNASLVERKGRLIRTCESLKGHIDEKLGRQPKIFNPTPAVCGARYALDITGFRKLGAIKESEPILLGILKKYEFKRMSALDESWVRMDAGEGHGLRLELQLHHEPMRGYCTGMTRGYRKWRECLSALSFSEQKRYFTINLKHKEYYVRHRVKGKKVKIVMGDRRDGAKCQLIPRIKGQISYFRRGKMTVLVRLETPADAIHAHCEHKIEAEKIIELPNQDYRFRSGLGILTRVELID